MSTPTSNDVRLGIDIGAGYIKAVLCRPDGSILTLGVIEAGAQPLRVILGLLSQAKKVMGNSRIICGLTGVGAGKVQGLIYGSQVNELLAIANAIDLLYPQTATCIELGQEVQRVTWLERTPPDRDHPSGKLLIADSQKSGKCAAGSGSFLRHMANRLNYASIEEFAEVAEKTEAATLAGRCAVFTESDIVHLYQKGVPREKIAAGIHKAIALKCRSMVGAREMVSPILFIGGVALNAAARKYLAQAFELPLVNIHLPKSDECQIFSALGAALRAKAVVDIDEAIAKIEARLAKKVAYRGTAPIKLERSIIMQPEEQVPFAPGTVIEKAGLGVDIGSVSTKAALVTVDDQGKLRIIAAYYRLTDGDPLAAVQDTLAHIHMSVQEQGLTIKAVRAGTTGSGRYLTGEYIGADIVRNEITAQAAGTRAFYPEVESILEIGGQDSKYIRLEGGVIIDFEMNKACAAGTGSFLTKQAQRLAIELPDFGPRALRNTRPPDLDWTCTVFCETSLFECQQNNVPMEDILAAACLAVTKNYVHKNLAGHELSEKVAFQGAVALNVGMIAAFETVLDRPIVVPPYPQYTGAIGVGYLAYLTEDGHRFRGFEELAKLQYENSSFECKGCENRCEVSTFCLEGDPQTFFFGDRCEKHSGAQKKKLGQDLPNLVGEREEAMLAGWDRDDNPDKPVVAIPRGLMFSEYAPLYIEFFQRLGFRVVISEPTNKDILKRGVTLAPADSCLPLKAAYGHWQHLVERKRRGERINYLFDPRVISTEQPNPNLPQSQACPLIQGAVDLKAAAIDLEKAGIELIAPTVHLIRGRVSLANRFVQVGQELGFSRGQSLRAFRQAHLRLEQFRSQIQSRGREILANLKSGERAFVLVGRPYALNDPAMNMNVARKIQDMGILAIPQDYLPLDEVDISETWPNAFSRQIQKKLQAARLIARDARLSAIVLTYFGCGADSFANPWFKDEIGEPCYVMQMDEHTADAGVITRIEAFADTATAKHKTTRLRYAPRQVSIGQVKGKKRVWLPGANFGSEVLAKVMGCYGVDAEVLPRTQDSELGLARAAISENVCVPMLWTTQEQLEQAARDFDPRREVFFQGDAEGPCRYGMYAPEQKRILQKLGLRTVDVISLGMRDEKGGLGIKFALCAWDALVTLDLLEKMLLKVRPYEQSAGATDRWFAKWRNELLETIPRFHRGLESRALRGLARADHLAELTELLAAAEAEILAIPMHKGYRPLIGVIGEFYVRIREEANENVVRTLESFGAECWLAPMTEFFIYANRHRGLFARDFLADTWRSPERWLRGRNFGELDQLWKRSLNHRLASRDEHLLWHACRILADREDIGPDLLLDLGSEYVTKSFGGETIVSMGKAVDFARTRRVQGIVNVVPFGCMPGIAVTALLEKFRQDHHVPVLTLTYDGFTDPSRRLRIGDFMAQVWERTGQEFEPSLITL